MRPMLALPFQIILPQIFSVLQVTFHHYMGLIHEPIYFYIIRKE